MELAGLTLAGQFLCWIDLKTLLHISAGRWDEAGSELFRLKDQHGVEFCLGPVRNSLNIISCVVLVAVLYCKCKGCVTLQST